MSAIFLPDGYVWLGFDENGISVAASIEKCSPALQKRNVVDGCVEILLCKLKPGQSSFGLMRGEVEIVE